MIVKDFKALKITLASPDQILDWSHGEVKKAETINYRTQRSEVGGLMCEKIFGPVKNYECYCGKYKKIRYKGIICDKCGVEVTTRAVRRERMGHIKLASPIAHIWYVHEVPNKLALLLDIPQKKIVSALYYSRYMVTDIDLQGKEEALSLIKDRMLKEEKAYKEALLEKVQLIEKENKKITEELKKNSKDLPESMDLQVEKINFEYRQKIARLKESEAKKFEEQSRENKSLYELIQKIVPGEVISEEEYGNLTDEDIEFYTLDMGAEAIRKMLKRLDLNALSTFLYKEIHSRSIQRKVRAIQRLRIVEGFRKNNLKPEWMIMDVIPVIPPDLRPIIQLSEGRFATSDLNDLYRRVINRNNRLKKLIDLGAPDVILRNEKRMLQESVDALFDNQHRSSPPVVDSRRNPLKSLSDNIRGKHGRFRENLLGKRVDYSGRAVIIAGPDLNLYQCGLPKMIALELFRPFVIREILLKGLAPNIKSAKVFFEEKPSEIWDILEEIIQNRPVLLNRAPTLHKQGVQGFYPILIDGNAIKLHPLVCEGFNADFDGDAMAVHVPLSEESIEEVKRLMMIDSNLFLAADGSLVVNPKKDIIYGCFYLTSIDGKLRLNNVFSSQVDALSAYDKGMVSLREPIKVRVGDNSIIDTSIGRLIFNSSIPEKIPFINEVVTDVTITTIIMDILDNFGKDKAIEILDNFKNLGFKYALQSDFSISISDCDELPGKEQMIEEADEKMMEISRSTDDGMVTKNERKQLTSVLWQDVTSNIAEESLKNLSDGNILKTIVENKLMGANIDQLKQIIGMKGLGIDPNNNIIELPIKSNYARGLSVFEYLLEARMTRKGLADVALRTSDSGYLTRRMVDVAHDVIVREEDCKNFSEGYEIIKDKEKLLSFSDRIYGRVLAKDIEVNGKILYSKNTVIDRKISKSIDKDKNIQGVFVRTPLTCGTQYGICSMCYGYSMSDHSIVSVGTAVGVIAAQALGQKGSQLTLNSKHFSSIMGAANLSRDYPRIEELLEARIPKGEAKISPINGTVKIEETGNKVKVTISGDEKIRQDYILIKGDEQRVEDKAKVIAGTVLYTNTNGMDVLSPFKGIAYVEKGRIYIESEKVRVVDFTFPKDEVLLVNDGDKVAIGTEITKGNIDPNMILKASGITKAQKYVIDNLIGAYEDNGLSVYDKHIEVIVSQMGRYVKIIDPGDSDLLPGVYKDIFVVNEINKNLANEDKRQVTFERKISGITASALQTESFLSAASFQEQVRVLSDAAIMGKVDYLRGLKENVIIGRKIPVGDRARLD